MVSSPIEFHSLANLGEDGEGDEDKASSYSFNTCITADSGTPGLIVHKIHSESSLEFNDVESADWWNDSSPRDLESLHHDDSLLEDAEESTISHPSSSSLRQRAQQVLLQMVQRFCGEASVVKRPDTKNRYKEFVLNAFYDRMQKQYIADEPAACTSSAKQNLKELYLDDTQRGKAYAASSAFLDTHSEWLRGPSALSREALLARVALQHLASVEVEDLSLPEEQRRSHDQFSESHAGFCEQFLKDAVRGGEYRICGEELSFAQEANKQCEQFLKDAVRGGEYRVGGEELSFAQDANDQGLTLAENPSNFDRLKEDFIARLVAALRQGLGERSTPIVLQATSVLMSQSGMAHLERACSSPAVVVSGGTQVIRYELDQCGPEFWEIRLLVRKADFSEAIVSSPPTTTDAVKDFELVPDCQPGSMFEKSCSLILFKAHDGSLQIDVTAFNEKLKLLDGSGGAQTFQDGTYITKQDRLNMCLKVQTLWGLRGLKMRKTKHFHDLSGESIPWGSIVAGVEEGDGWLRVGDGYLPMVLQGCPVIFERPPGQESSGSAIVSIGLGVSVTSNVIRLELAVKENLMPWPRHPSGHLWTSKLAFTGLITKMDLDKHMVELDHDWLFPITALVGFESWTMEGQENKRPPRTILGHLVVDHKVTHCFRECFSGLYAFAKQKAQQATESLKAKGE